MSPSETFINPYTFVPFPEIADPGGFRGAPAGHARCEPGRLGGRIDVELMARGPLLLRGVRRGDRATSEEGEEISLFPRRTFPGHGDEPVPFLPGSSLAGVVRSLHELIAGGCLRVFDDGFRPGYRDFAQARDRGWTLALVEAVENGRPTRLRLCSQVAWAPARALARVLGGADQVVTGARVDIKRAEPKTFGKGGGSGSQERTVTRHEVSQDDWLGPGDGWVVLVTSQGARRDGKSFWCATGKLADGRTVGVTDAAWRDYQDAVAGTDDVRRARQDPKNEGDLFPDRPLTAPVSYRFPDGKRLVERLVGHRHKARPGLHPGQVLWVKRPPQNAGDARVEGLALSHIWRHSGARAAGERVPEELLPCEEPGTLCPTCRVFGSADTSGADTPDSRQHGYRGHLRFSDARPVGTVQTRVERIAALGAPRPGAGQFYLQRNKTKPHVNATPLREWGSRADEGAAGPRRLRGRKQYWLTGRHEERPMFRVANRDWPSTMATTAEAAGAGSRFTFSVHFDGLGLAELGGLLAALSPGLLLGDRGEDDQAAVEIGYAVGGGRPFGFGSCTAAVTALEADTPASRYAGAAAPEPTVHEAIEAFRERVDAGVRDTWPAVTAALTLDRVEPGTVWYPPERPFEPSGPLEAEHLQPKEVKLEFWRYTQGFRMEHGEDPLVSLPPIENRNQSLRVDGLPGGAARSPATGSGTPARDTRDRGQRGR